MNYIDIVIAVSLLYGLIKGFSNGLIKEITNILSVVIAIYIGFHFANLVEPYLQHETPSTYEGLVPLASFLIVFIIILVIIKSIGELIDRLTKMLALGIVSKFLGAIFGFFKIMVILSGVHFFLSQYQLINESKTKKESILFQPIQSAAAIIIPKINQHKDAIIKKANKNTNKAKQKIKEQVNN